MRLEKFPLTRNFLLSHSACNQMLSHFTLHISHSSSIDCPHSNTGLSRLSQNTYVSVPRVDLIGDFNLFHIHPKLKMFQGNRDGLCFRIIISRVYKFSLRNVEKRHKKPATASIKAGKNKSEENSAHRLVFHW